MVASFQEMGERFLNSLVRDRTKTAERPGRNCCVAGIDGPLWGDSDSSVFSPVMQDLCPCTLDRFVTGADSQFMQDHECVDGTKRVTYPDPSIWCRPEVGSIVVAFAQYNIDVGWHESLSDAKILDDSLPSLSSILARFPRNLAFRAQPHPGGVGAPTINNVSVSE